MQPLTPFFTFKKLKCHALVLALLWAGTTLLSSKEGRPVYNSSDGSTYSHYLNALILERSGEFELALKEYNRTLELAPEATLIYRLRATLHLKMGDPEKALADAQAYAKATPDDVESLLLLSSIHLVIGQRAAAQLILEKVLKEHPDHADALFTLATLLMADDSEKAIKLLEKYLALDPNSVEAYYNLGLLYQKQGNPKSAEMFKKVIELDGDSVPALVLLGQMSEREDNFSAAAQYYETALKKIPDNFSLRMQLVIIYSQLKEFEKIEPLLEAYKNDPAAPLEANLWLGIVYENKKDWNKALEHYSRAQEQSNMVELNVRMASVYSQLGNGKKALKTLKNIVQQVPSSAQFRYFLGLAYLDMKKPKRALKEFQKAAQLKQDFSSAYFQAGVALDTLKKWDEAEALFKQAIAVDTTNASAYNYVGYTLADRNLRLNEARKMIERALEMDPFNPAFLDSLGWLNFREGRYTAALQQLLQASEAMADPVIFFHIAECHYADGNLSEAAVYYGKALELDPKNKEVRKKLEKLNERMVPTSPARKIVKQFEYNLNRASNISGLISFRQKHWLAPTFVSPNGRGIFYLRKGEGQPVSSNTLSNSLSPVELRIDLLDYLFVPAVTLRFQNKPILRWSTFPPELKRQLPEETESVLEIVTSFLNGRYLKEFDNWQTLIQEKGGSYVLTNGALRMGLNKKEGVIDELSINDRTIKIEKFRNIEGILLPEKIRVTWYDPGEKHKRELQIEFSQLSLKKIENKVFEIGKEVIVP